MNTERIVNAIAAVIELIVKALVWPLDVGTKYLLDHTEPNSATRRRWLTAYSCMVYVLFIVGFVSELCLLSPVGVLGLTSFVSFHVMINSYSSLQWGTLVFLGLVFAISSREMIVGFRKGIWGYRSHWRNVAYVKQEMLEWTPSSKKPVDDFDLN